MKCLQSVSAVLVCLCLLATAAADLPADLKTLQSARDDALHNLQETLKSAKPADGQYRLELKGGVEGDDVLFHISHFAGKKDGYAVVPWWRQETQKEKFNFRHRDGGGSFHRDKFFHPIAFPKGEGPLDIGDGKLTGKLAVEYRLDLPRNLRMPPGGKHLYTTDGRWSLVDQWYVGPRVTPRRQTYHLDARVLPDVRRLKLTLDGGIDGRPLHLTATLPADAWGDATAKAPTWNAGVHEADAAGLAWKDGRLTGQLRVKFNPDAWFPKKVWYATYEMDVTVRDGVARGTYTASVAEGDYAKVTGQKKGGKRPTRDGAAAFEGSVSGTVLAAVVGRYESTGPLGKRQGRVVGGLLPVVSEPNRLLAEPAGTPGRRATTLYNQFRALHEMLAQPTRPMAELLAKHDVPAPVWNGNSPDAESDYVEHLARIVAADDKLRRSPEHGRASQKNPQFGPYYGTEPLAVSSEAVMKVPEVDEKGDQTWKHVSSWKVLGPLPVAKLPWRPHPALPRLVPATDAARPIDTAPFGRHYKGPAEITWQTVKTAEDGTLLPPPWTWGKKGRLDRPGREDCEWYASAVLDSPVTQDVYIAIDAHDFATLRLNDRLVWIDEERQRNYRTLRPTVLKVQLAKGENRLLLRVRDDRAESFARVTVCTAGGKSADSAEPLFAARPKADPDTPEPPLAWDAAKGTNVDWSADVEGARGQPVVAGKRIYVAADPHDVVCLDAETGKQLWRSSANVLELIGKDAAAAFAKADQKQRRELLEKHLGKQFARGEPDTPAVQGSNIYLHVGTGVLACFDAAEGKRRWMTRTYMTEASLLLVDGKLIVAGAASSDWAKAHGIEADDFSSKTVRRAGHNYGSSSNHTLDRLRKLQKGHHGLMAVAPDGKTLYAVAAAGTYSGRPLLLTLPTGTDKTRPVLITRTAEAYDPATGGRLRKHINLGVWDWLSATTDGRSLFSAWEGGRGGAALWLSDAGLGYRRTWGASRLHAYVAGGPNDGVADGGLYYVWRRVGEHAKHCPAYRLQLDVFNTENGRRVGWVKPAIRSTNRAVQPAKIGNYLFLSDTRGGPHSGGEPHERQVVVATAEAQPVLVARNATPDVSGPPVPCGNGLLMRCGGKLLRVAVQGHEGKTYQEKVIARHVFERIYDAPADRKTTRVKPLDITPDCDTPVMPLADAASLSDWLVAGPFPKGTDAAPAADFLPATGKQLKLDGKSVELKPLDDELVTMKTSFHNDGRLDDWQLRRTVKRIDLSALKDKGDGVYYLAAVVDNPRRRLVYSAMDAEGLTVYLAGRKIDAGEPLDLAAGRYPLVVRAEPDSFRRRRPTPSVNLAAAVQADAVRKVDWPSTWTVFGPIPEAGGVPETDQFKSIPKAMKVGETSYRPIALPSIGRTLDLTAIIDLAKDEKPDVGDNVQSKPVKQGQSAWAMAEVNLPAAGTLLVNASADWFMEWYVDGERVYSTLSKGNMRNPVQLDAHTFGVKLPKGKHVVAVRVKPGSKGWSVTSLGALATDDLETLAGKHPGKGMRAAEPEWRVNLIFRQVDHPQDVGRVRLRQIGQASRLLRRIVTALDNQPESQRALRMLKDLEETKQDEE